MGFDMNPRLLFAAPRAGGQLAKARRENTQDDHNAPANAGQKGAVWCAVSLIARLCVEGAMLCVHIPGEDTE
ncbi:hypothetical protein CEP88_16930 [Roseobacter denitrificans]|nr:hypothetical protein CEP88_16930 [Roseobacter denitrificans]